MHGDPSILPSHARRDSDGVSALKKSSLYSISAYRTNAAQFDSPSRSLIPASWPIRDFVWVRRELHRLDALSLQTPFTALLAELEFLSFRQQKPRNGNVFAGSMRSV